jgi:hypothetical protein
MKSNISRKDGGATAPFDRRPILASFWAPCLSRAVALGLVTLFASPWSETLSHRAQVSILGQSLEVFRGQRLVPHTWFWPRALTLSVNDVRSVSTTTAVWSRNSSSHRMATDPAFESDPLSALLAQSDRWAAQADPELLKRNAKGQSPKVRVFYFIFNATVPARVRLMLKGNDCSFFLGGGVRVRAWVGWHARCSGSVAVTRGCPRASSVRRDRATSLSM